MFARAVCSPQRFSRFFERIMETALEKQKGTVRIGGSTITNFRFADDIDGLGGSEEELNNLVEGLDKASKAAGMETFQIPWSYNQRARFKTGNS